jgi:hypothetical protein
MKDLRKYAVQDVQMIRAEYAKGTPLKDIVAMLKKKGAKTPKGAEYATSTVSYVANSFGLRRQQLRKTQVKHKARVYVEGDILVQFEDILTSNLSAENKRKFISILAKDL